jgi:zinc/manganese transport system ATP-binding protein
MMNHAIAFENVTLGYDRQPAVLRLQAKISEGSLTAIVGPNGAGKSTLLKGVVGTLAPLAGNMSLGDIKKTDIAYLPQQSEVDRSFPMTVLELVAMGLWKKIGAFASITQTQNASIKEAISAVGLTGFESRQIGSLSGGQMQRALFARLLLQDAQLVLLDEPFNSIDTRTMSDLIDVIRQWHSEGRTVVAVLHDAETVRENFPQTMMLARELVAHGPTAEVLTADNQFRARQMCEACEGPPHTCGRVPN